MLGLKRWWHRDDPEEPPPDEPAETNGLDAALEERRELLDNKDRVLRAFGKAQRALEQRGAGAGHRPGRGT